MGSQRWKWWVRQVFPGEGTLELRCLRAVGDRPSKQGPTNQRRGVLVPYEDERRCGSWPERKLERGKLGQLVEGWAFSLKVIEVREA